MKQFIRHAAPITLIAALLAGCSGASDTAGIEGTGDRVAAKGTVTAFGSIWVNGVRFETNDAAIVVDGKEATEAEILPGMVVQVNGSESASGTASAQAVTADALISGPVTAVDSLGLPYAQIQVLGQTVIIPEEAVFAGLTRSELAVGINLRVNGLSEDGGSALATRIDLLPAIELVDAEGHVTQLDISQAVLTLGELEVNFADATFVGGTQEELALGQQVKVMGRLSDGDSLRLNADFVHFRFTDSTEQAAGSKVVWEGLIEAFNAPATFELNSVLVDATDAEVSGGDAEQLDNGVRVAVSGRLDTHNTLIADSVKLLLPSETRFAAQVEEVSRQTQTLTVLSNQFSSDAFTAYEDDSPGKNKRMGFKDIESGDTLEVFGRQIDGQWVATRIRKIGSDSAQSSFRGPVSRIISDTEIRVMGVNIDLSSAEGADLVAELSTGDHVNIVGVQTGARAVTASLIERADKIDCPAPVAAACKGKAGDKPGQGTPGPRPRG